MAADNDYVIELWVDGEKTREFEGMKPAPFLKKLARRKGVELIIRRKEKNDALS
jgi:hypothetical protein